jgi:hypothetical protein
LKLVVHKLRIKEHMNLRMFMELQFLLMEPFLQMVLEPECIHMMLYCEIELVLKKLHNLQICLTKIFLLEHDEL